MAAQAQAALVPFFLATSITMPSISTMAPVGAAAAACPLQTKWLTVPLDHFGSFGEPRPSFPLRYLDCDAFCTRSSDRPHDLTQCPVIMYPGNEGPITAFANASGELVPTSLQWLCVWPCLVFSPFSALLFSGCVEPWPCLVLYLFVHFLLLITCTLTHRPCSCFFYRALV
jgi:hypothetical protein